MLPVLLAQLWRASRCVVFYAGCMCAAPVAQSDGEFTIDELAARTGMTVRTVRFYATEGLLPPPERRGRVAYYGADHRRRLELIRTLQEHGYTLSAVERVLRKMTVADREQLAEPFDRFATAAGEPVDDTLTLIWAPT